MKDNENNILFSIVINLLMISPTFIPLCCDINNINWPSVASLFREMENCF